MKEQFYQFRKRAIVSTLLLGLALALNPGVTGQDRPGDGMRLRMAYENGYRAGYPDGYEAGKNDFAGRMGRDYQRHTLYQEADRGYDSRFGPRVDFKEGYSLGFEVGYFDGYVGRAFDSRIPPNVARPGGRIAPIVGQRGQRTIQPLIPEGALLRIRLETLLTTELNREGDSFTARVIEPREYEGALIEGHIAKIERSGRMTGRTEMALDFDAVTLRNGRSGPFHAQIEKVFASESVKSVDEEGNVESASKTKETEIRTIGGAVLGAIIGGIAGGGKGAAIGAIIGAGTGAGSVYVQGDKDLILEPGAQMLARVDHLPR
ncbi:MAG TPA: hypothetical protein VFY40_17340 [Blastocatellia bacterium]|nr:hypothetical protein [Blastocatellia bacterium]